MANISKLKRKLTSRHLYDNVRGKSKELAIVCGFLNRLQLGPVTITAGERPDFSLSFGNGALHVGLESKRGQVRSWLLTGSVSWRTGSDLRKVMIQRRKIAE